MEHKMAGKVYRWLWWSPLLTVPTNILILFWDPGYELNCCSRAVEERITGITAIVISALWHLVLLGPAINKKSLLVRWHGRQAIVLAGLRTAIPLLAVLLFGFWGLIFAIFALMLVWLAGTMLGQEEAKKGICSLARWFGHAKELPGPPVPTTEEEIQLLVKIIRFSKDQEARSEALDRLETLGVVEYL